jgi:hypothetical protein
VTDHCVAGDRVLLDTSFRAARDRLKTLARDGMLQRASDVAYGEGITGLVKAAGPAAGLTRLALVRPNELAGTDHCTHLAIQWEAIAADGKLFTGLMEPAAVMPGGPEGGRDVAPCRSYAARCGSGRSARAAPPRRWPAT